MSDPTKPDAPDGQTKPDELEPTTPETGREDQPIEPSKPRTEPSKQFTPEQYEAAVRAMNDAQRKAADLERQNALLNEIAEQHRKVQDAFGPRQQQQDPEESAMQKYMAARENYDVAAEAAALRELNAARDQKLRQSMMNDVIRQQRLLQSMPVAQQMLGVKDENLASQQLAHIYQSMTPDEIALVALKRQNKIAEWVATQQEESERKRQQAEALRALPGLGGGGRVPGAGAPKAKAMPYETWLAGSEEAKQAWRDADEELLIIGAPPGFDPMKD